MKNLKRLMSVVLSVVMLLSFVISTSAATFTDVAETDNAFEAIEVLAALKVLEGKEAGVFDPEANIKRSEFAAVICRAMNQSPVGLATFVDVPEDHWAYDYIAWAASQNIVKGKGEGKFDPDANVTYNEAITMIVRAMGYEYYVEEYLGGFPTGYTRIAGSYKIDSGVNTSNGNAAASRADVAQLVYNAFEAPLMDYSYAIGNDTEYVIYNGSKNVDYEKRTLLSYYSGIYKVKATVDNTFKNDPTLTDARGNKMVDLTAISYYGFDKDNCSWLIDGLSKTKTYWEDGDLQNIIANNEAWANYQGYTVDAYLTLNDNNKLEVVAMVPVTASGTELVIENAKEVINAATVANPVVFEYEDENGKERTPDIAVDAVVYVNNINVGALSGAAYDADAVTAFESLDDGAYPSVTLLDSDDNGVYDKIYMINYVYGIVEEVDADYEVITTTDGAAYELSEDDTQDGFVYTIYKDGAEIAITDLVAGDLINVVIGAESGDVADATFVDIYVTNDTIESSVSSVANEGTLLSPVYVYTIDGERYYTASTNMCGDLDPGDTGIFHITIDGYIYDVDFTSTYSDNYGLILEMGESVGAFGDAWQIKILDKTNTVRVIPVKTTSLFVSTDGGNTKTQYRDAAVDTQLTTIDGWFTNEYGPVADAGTNTATLASDKADAIAAIEANLAKRLVTFKEVNGEITELVFAQLGGGVRDYNYATLAGAYSSKTGRLAGKELLDNTVLFNFPLERAIEKSDIVVSSVDKDMYTLNTDLIQVYAQSGLVTGDSYNGFVYNVDSNNAIGAAILTDDMGFAGDANALAVVVSKSTGLDAAGNSATVITFMQAGETKSLAIADTYVGDAALTTAVAGDVFQYTENAAGEIGNATVIFDYTTKTILEAGDIDDIAYVAGLVTENTGKVVTLAADNGVDTYAWDLADGCTNVLYNTARAGKANAFNAKSGTSYIRAYKADGSGNFTTDAYMAVVRMDEGVIVDVVAYVFAEEFLLDDANDAIDTDAEFIGSIND